MRTFIPIHSLGGRLAALTLAAILCVAGALPLASGADAGRHKTVTLHVYERTRSLQLERADGRVVKRLPLPDPRPGDVLDGVFDVFKGTHARHGRRPIGGDHLRCKFVAAGPPECVSHAVLGSSMLVVEGSPGRITFGTGRFLGASGRVLSTREVQEAPRSQLAHNDIDVVVRINRR